MPRPKKAFVVTHKETSGSIDNALVDYLLSQGYKTYFITHSFENATDRKSRLYLDNSLVKESFDFKHFPNFLVMLKDFLYTFLYFLSANIHSVDLYIGLGTLNAFAGAILKRMGIVKRSIFYTIDFSPNRFNNKFLNGVFVWVDKYNVRNCSEVWNVSTRIAEGREKYYGYGLKKYPNQKVVPVGVYSSRVKKISYTNCNKYQLVYVGSHSKKQGLQLLVKALPLIRKKIPEISLITIGRGDYLEKLRILAKELQVDDIVQFKGYVESREEVERVIAKSVLGVALYSPRLADFTYYADPGKIKDYLGVGVPVITTNVSPNTNQLKHLGVAVLVNYNINNLDRTITSSLLNSGLMEKMRLASVKYSKEIDWDKIFSVVLSIKDS